MRLIEAFPAFYDSGDFVMVVIGGMMFE